MNPLSCAAIRLAEVEARIAGACRLTVGRCRVDASSRAAGGGEKDNAALDGWLGDDGDDASLGLMFPCTPR